jgi:hypothetical protein
MVAVDLERGELLTNWAVKEDAAQRFPLWRLVEAASPLGFGSALDSGLPNQ